MPFEIAQQDWEAILAGLARGSYSLLLGAGASRDGRDATGRQLPLGSELADDLIAEFALPAEHGKLSLPRAYDAAARRPPPSTHSSLNAYLAERFSGCSAPTWFQSITSIEWARIWTLNVDDTLDDAYIAARDSRVQRLRSVHWSRPFFDQAESDVVPAIYLHGRARALVDEDTANLVFGLEQYLDAGRQKYAWHHVFGDLFQSEPFIIVGASLSDEYDLAGVLRRGNGSRDSVGLPSVAVLRSIDALRREELEAWGLIPVTADAGDFFASLDAELPNYRLRLPIPRRRGEIAPPRALKFLSQFRPLEPDEEVERDSHHDLYAGHEPTWQDIVRDRDAVFDVAQHAAEIAKQAFQGHRTERVLCIHGERFSGKTTATLRAARRLRQDAIPGYLFVGEERLDVSAVKWWAERSPRTLLIFDGLADFARDLEELLGTLDLDAVNLVVLGNERAARVERLDVSLPPERFKAGDELFARQLSDHDINALIERLERAGRLGRISRRDHGGRVAYFRSDHHRQLFAAMAGLEHAAGFVQRMRAQYEAIDDVALRRAFATCALVHALGYATPVPLVAAACELPARHLLRAAVGVEALGELVVIDRGRMRARQRTLASLFVENILTTADRYEITSALATALSPYVSIATMGQRTLYTKIARELMDENVLEGWIGLSNLERWYEQQATYYSWNARFWEQRALAATRRGLWEPAESYAERAVHQHEDPFTLNTLAVVLLRKAEAMEPRSGSRWDYYWRAERALAESRSAGRGEYMHPYVTFFEYTLRIVADEGATGAAQMATSLAATWQDWMTRARQADAFAHARMREQLERYQFDWLREATSGAGSAPT